MIVVIAAALLIGADDQPAARIQWSATSTGGAEVKVPSGKVTIVAFVRPGQPQSAAVLEQIRSIVAERQDVQVIRIISGKHESDDSSTTTSPQGGWPIVLDPSFDASGRFDVHVWPTTVVVTPAGEPAARLAGLRDSFAADLRDHLEFAAGKIDADVLKQKLAEHEVVGDTNGKDRPERHLTVATRLIESGQLDEAAAQLAEGLKARPGDPKLNLTLARVLLLQEKPSEALALLDTLPSGAAPPWQIGCLRSRALIDLGRWDEARALLPDAVKLNPDPAEAHYLQGLVFQHDAQWQQAAEAFRKAYEMRR